MEETQMAEEMEQILEYYAGLPDKHQEDKILDLLRELQDLVGYISPGLKERAAQTAGVKASYIQAIIRMHPSLKEADYIHEITVCTGRNCFENGGRELLDSLQKELKFQKNGISRDGKILLKKQNCLRHCQSAPNVQVDGILCGQASVRSIKEMLEKKRKE